MYAVEFFFEENFEQYVQGIWIGLNDEKLSSSMNEISEIRPHITVGVYNDILDVETYFKRFNSFFNTELEIDLKFDVLASFPTSGTLFIGPTVTEGLILLHKQYHQEFSDLSEYANHFYIPENWDPHCSLAIRLNAEEMIEAIKYCYKNFIPHRSKIIEVGLVKLDLDSSGKCHSSLTIFSKVLIRKRLSMQ
jgi:2'-5' RNA ligase